LGKTKHKSKLIKKTNVVSLGEFLGGEKYMSMEEAERIIRRSVPVARHRVMSVARHRVVCVARHRL